MTAISWLNTTLFGFQIASGRRLCISPRDQRSVGFRDLVIAARPPRLNPTGEAAPDYCLPTGLRQPHSQLFIWQRHAFFWHSQEQVPQSQLPQQLDSPAVFAVVFVKSDIIVLPYLGF